MGRPRERSWWMSSSRSPGPDTWSRHLISENCGSHGGRGSPTARACCVTIDAIDPLTTVKATSAALKQKRTDATGAPTVQDVPPTSQAKLLSSARDGNPMRPTAVLELQMPRPADEATNGLGALLPH